MALAVSDAAIRRLALASLVSNVVIVVTGGAVRLSGSGLGCPTWPRCTDESYVATAQMGVYGAIEFGNRMVSMVVGAIAIAVVLAAGFGRPRRRELLPLAASVLGLVLLQGVIGGISVRVQLNPWVVAAHFLSSMVLLAVGYALWQRTVGSAPWQRATAHPPAGAAPRLRPLALLLTGVSFLVLVIGAVVTGSGPHSGDADAGRTGLDPEMISQVHADAVFLLLGLSVALWLALRADGAVPRAARAAGVLVLVELAQGLVGFVQYFTHLPALAVGAHMLGACLVWLATLATLWSIGGHAQRAEQPSGMTAGGAGPDRPGRERQSTLVPCTQRDQAVSM